MKNSNHTYRLTLSALMLALCFILPNFTGNIPHIGSMLLPMHLPVLLCGFLCGPLWGGAVGFIAPILRSLLMTMPPMAIAIPMSFELMTYGFVCGLLYRVLSRKNLKSTAIVYGALLSSMVLGRAVYGVIKAGMTMGTNDPYTFTAFIAGTVTSAVPGIILQLIVVPAVVLAVNKQSNKKWVVI